MSEEFSSIELQRQADMTDGGRLGFSETGIGHSKSLSMSIITVVAAIHI
jgi:hypothetical protein